MPPYADIYILAGSRTAATIENFLQHFVPAREESAEDYEIPRYAKEPQKILRTATEVIDCCCRHPAATQSIYWRSVGQGDPAHAMVFFTSDAQLILGVSVDETAADRFFAELRAHTHSHIGYITVEAPPPSTAAEFRRIARKSASS